MARVKSETIKVAVLGALHESGKALTVGDLFLVTKYSHEAIRTALRDLKIEGVVRGEIRRHQTTTYSGHITEHDSMHWWVLPEPTKTSSNKKIRRSS